MCDNEVSLEYLFEMACNLWEDRWTFLPVYLTNVPSEKGIETIETEGCFQYRISVRPHRGYVMDENPISAMKKAIERWGD